MSDVPGALNFRDVGGLPAGAARTRAGVLFRSGNLARLDDDGRAVLARLGIRRIVDLREDDELAREPSRLGALPVETVRVPLFLGSTASFFVEDISLPEMYRALVDGSADRIIAAARAVIADQPVLVHCTVGKDRTGVTIALLLAAAGVEEDAVVSDYARTETLLPRERNARVVAHLRRMHPEARHLEDLATRSPAPVMRTVLEDVSARFGSAADYLRAGGMADDELRALRDVLIDRD
ncbi:MULTISPECIES: tyrosine-protein phosphatase [Microbacterium]|uniref:Protein tyrosine phosphatase n=1 Tax=Microbacterium aurum TaxID=36805 RepID=A0A1P8UA22_9MICO|nr:tyrosine-protein phosphatase [Microbacterium aurum]APZ34967.1 protein tyrosine phosphatase [Microbacterium aurum]MBM7828906.1 protein-tyrosine phosphatase [Microbacterium aurum]